MRSAKSVFPVLISLALWCPAASAQEFGLLSMERVRSVDVPLPGAPSPVRFEGPNDTTTEPAPGTGRYGADPDPYEWLKPEAGYASPRMKDFADKGLEGSGVPKDMLDRALRYFDANKAVIKNTNYLGIIDFSKHSDQARFFVINMNDNTVAAYHVAHGKGSDPNQSGYLRSFSNEPGSLKTSRGFFKVGEPFQGSEVGYSAFLDGLTTGHNSNVRAREIVIHGAWYVTENPPHAGLSWGCFALDSRVNADIIAKFRGGAIIYADTSGDLFRE